MSPKRKILLGAFGASAVVFVVLSLKLFRYPSTHVPDHADAVVMLAGGGDRVDRAVELGVDQGVADTVVFSAVWIADGGFWAARPCNVSGRERMGDTTAICFEPDPGTTRGEVREIARMARDNDWKSIVVVASTDQITRARLLLSRCWDGEAHFVGVDHNQPFIVRAVYEWGALAKALTTNRSC